MPELDFSAGIEELDELWDAIVDVNEKYIQTGLYNQRDRNCHMGITLEDGSLKNTIVGRTEVFDQDGTLIPIIISTNIYALDINEESLLPKPPCACELLFQLELDGQRTNWLDEPWLCDDGDRPVLCSKEYSSVKDMTEDVKKLDLKDLNIVDKSDLVSLTYDKYLAKDDCSLEEKLTNEDARQYPLINLNNLERNTLCFGVTGVQMAIDRFAKETIEHGGQNPVELDPAMHNVWFDELIFPVNYIWVPDENSPNPNGTLFNIEVNMNHAPFDCTVDLLKDNRYIHTFRIEDETELIQSIRNGCTNIYDPNFVAYAYKVLGDDIGEHNFYELYDDFKSFEKVLNKYALIKSDENTFKDMNHIAIGYTECNVDDEWFVVNMEADFENRELRFTLDSKSSQLEPFGVEKFDSIEEMNQRFSRICIGYSDAGFSNEEFQTLQEQIAHDNGKIFAYSPSVSDYGDVQEYKFEDVKEFIEQDLDWKLEEYNDLAVLTVQSPSLNCDTVEICAVSMNLPMWDVTARMVDALREFNAGEYAQDYIGNMVSPTTSELTDVCTDADEIEAQCEEMADKLEGKFLSISARGKLQDCQDRADSNHDEPSIDFEQENPDISDT